MGVDVPGLGLCQEYGIWMWLAEDYDQGMGGECNWLRISIRQWEVGVTGSGLCSIAGFSISSFDHLSSAAVMFITL